MSKGSFKTEFLHQLNNEEVCLDDRLHMAYGAIISQDFLLIGKEQVIMDWFAICLKRNVLELKYILKILTKCLNTDWMLTFSNAIDVSNLIEGFADLEDDNKAICSKQIINCLLLIMRSTGFQRYCRFEILPMCQAVLLFSELSTKISAIEGNLQDVSTDSPSNLSDVLELEDLFDHICNIHKVTQQRCELKLRFMQSILPALLKIKYNFHHSTKFQLLLEELVIGDDFEILCEAFKTKKPRNIPDHLKALVSLLTENEKHVEVVALTSILFNVYTRSSLKRLGNESSHLSLFYILTSVTGFNLQLPYESVSGSSNVSSLRLSILKELVDSLHKHNVPASSESEEGVLSNLLVEILRQLISEENPLTPALIQAVNSIFRVYPESVRLVFPGFVQHIVFVKKRDSIKKEYDTLLVDVIQIFCDLNQLEKFFSLFFHGGVLLSKEHNFSAVSSEMVLTCGFYSVLTEKLTSLTGNQLKVIIGRLEKTFSKNLVSQLDSSTLTDVNLCLLLKIMVQVLSHILENASIVVPTRWSNISEEMKTLILATQQFGIAVVKYGGTELLVEFLQLVRIMTDIELVMNEYVISLSTEKILPTVKHKDKSSDMSNLSKSHGFLSPNQWKNIAELVEESHDTALKHCWYDLLVQKYVRQSDPNVMTYLTMTTDSDWLWSRVSQLSSSVPLKHLELFSDQLLRFSSFSDLDLTDTQVALSSINVVTNRPFRAAMNIQLVKQMSRIIPDKNSLLKSIVKLIDTYSIVEFEADISVSKEKLEHINTMIEALAHVINKCTWEESSHHLNEADKEQFVRLVDMMTAVNPHCLKSGTKRILCLSLMALAHDLRAEGSLSYSVLESILGFMDDSSSVIPESLDRRVLVYWLSELPSKFTLRQQLIQATIAKVVFSLDKCADGMSQVLQADNGLLCAMLETLISARGSKGFRNKDEVNQLVKMLILLASTFIKKPKAKFLRLFTAALKAEFIFFKEKPPTLLTSLQVYLELLLNKFTESVVIVEANTTELLEFSLSLKTEIGEDVLAMVHKSVTEELCKIDFCPMLCYPKTIKAFFESLPLNVFEQVLNEICEHQQKALTIPSDEGLVMSNVCELWSVVVNAHVDKDKARVRQRMLTKVLSECQPILEREGANYRPVVIQLLYSVAVSKSMFLTSKLLDLIFVILGDAPTDTEAHLLPECLSVLNVLISVRAELIFDRIPAFLQRFRKFLKSLVLLSSAERDNDFKFNSMNTSSANYITRITKIITDQHAKHFARIAPYLIADILLLLVTYSIETSIKEELQSCVCGLLSVCDQHGSQLLQNLLPLASTELYKSLSTTYRKSFKYTGKV